MKKTRSTPNNCHLIEHPLVAHKLSLLRNKKTTNKIFRELIHELSCILAYEATRQHLTTSETTIETPIETTMAHLLAAQDKHPIIVPILRAGLGMTQGFLTMLPNAKVGYIGMYRSEENSTVPKPKSYYYKIPANSEDKAFFICDPMLATGGTAVAAINKLKSQRIHRLVFSCIIACPEGIAALQQAHPEVPIYTTSIDRELNQNYYIVPGLGDAGDRLFGTE